MANYDGIGRDEDSVLFALRNQQSVDDLKKLARLLTQEKLPTRKDDLIALLLPYFQGDALKDLWSRLDRIQQAAVSEATHSANGHLDMQRFRAKYNSEPSSGLPHLIFLSHGRIPKDLRVLLLKFVPEPPSAAIVQIEAVPESMSQDDYEYDAQGKHRKIEVQIPIERRDMELAAQRDLIAVLRLADAGKISVSDTTRWPSASGVKIISEVLDGSDFYSDQPEAKSGTPPQDDDDDDDGWEPETDAGPIRAFAWPLLLQAGGLAQINGKRLGLTKAGRLALTAPAHETLKMIWGKWIETTLLDELRRIDCIKGQTGKGKRDLTALAGRRRAIAAALSALSRSKEGPAGKWIALDEFSRYMQAADHKFEVTRDEWSLYISDAQYGSLGYDGYGGWNILQFRYVLCVLFEYAATLGLIDVAFIQPSGARHDYGKMWGADNLSFLSRYDGLLYLRVNALGAYAFGIINAYTPSPREQRKILSVLPNLEVVETTSLTKSDRLLLEKYADLVSERVWRLQRDNIVAALAAGHSLAELRDFLTASSGEPLPGPVSQFLEDIERRASLLRDAGKARLIECADAATAVLLANESTLKRHCLLSGERTLAIPNASEAAFVRGLQKLGYAVASK